MSKKKQENAALNAAYDLVVTEPFGAHVRGDRITDPDAIAKALAENAGSVVKVGKSQ